MPLEGVPSDQLPDVLATGVTDTSFAFLSFSGREPGKRDAEYIRWHTLDHRPEQYRLQGLRHACRAVSTPACRSVRAASVGMFDEIDHVMSYFFTSSESIAAFDALGNALHHAGRMPLRLPSIGFATAKLAGKNAAPHAVVGADVLPWVPTPGMYLIVEEGHASPEHLIEVPGVAGVWWFSGDLSEPPYASDYSGRQITYCYLDDDPVEVAKALAVAMRQRWASGEIKGLLAAPFYSIVPFEWARYLPH